MRRTVRRLLLPTSVFLVATGAHAQLPLKYTGPATSPSISAMDLMTRLYIFADDSMMGRAIGTPGNNKGTAYIEREVRRLGLRPAGDSAGYFQYVPIFQRRPDPASTIATDGAVFKVGTDFVATSAGTPKQIVDAPVVFGGALLDTTNILPNEAVRGKVVLVTPFIPTAGMSGAAFQQSNGFRTYQQSLAGAIIVSITGEVLSARQVQNTITDPPIRRAGVAMSSPITLSITNKVAEGLLGVPLASATKGMTGKPLTTDIRFVDAPVLARNVLAMIPGADPELKNEFVVIGAHSDHIGTQRPADHDSLRAYNQIVMPQGDDSPLTRPTPDDIARIRVITDSLHALHGGPRIDSIANGADDDGSGTVSLLEIAEAFAKGDFKPKRSILFAWHVGEEEGMWGSEYFTDNPTVPREAIVAELNVDMIGRGGASDITGVTSDDKQIHGGPGYLQLIGSRKLSTELGDLIERVNVEKQLGFQFDYSLDAAGHPQQIYCRSDHTMYARYGIPIAFFTTGGHADYHEVTDEPQYIDYVRLAQVAKLVFETSLRVANLDHRVAVDKPKPDPRTGCRQ